jgi:RHS repeat-associated protein
MIDSQMAIAAGRANRGVSREGKLFSDRLSGAAPVPPPADSKCEIHAVSRHSSSSRTSDHVHGRRRDGPRLYLRPIGPPYRQTADAVTTLADGLDDSVLRIELAHEVRGMLQTVTSYAAATGGSIVNQSVFVYDAFSNLIADQQSHSGVVVPGTTPEVDYRYADGSANTVRRTSVTYPNGRVLNTVYGTTNSAADHLNQITSLNVTGDGGDLADYTYCGTNWQVQIAYPLPGIELTYIKQGSEPVGDGGDQYTGYDRFGRTIDIRWQTTSDGTSLERLLYGYDQDSRRIWRQQVLATGLDNAYTYDGLGQVVTNALGILDTSIGTITPVPAQTEAWNYDPTGNWDNYTTAAGGAVTLDQIRIYDQGNRLTQIESDPKPILVDRAGRMLEVPPDATGDWTQSLTLVWDAWSRIVQLSQNGSVLGYYTYDGLTRRMTRAVSGVTWHTYYSDIWRPLEERQDTQTTAAAQYLWGTRHRDDLVRRDRATTSGGLLNETRYVLMDYFSPAAITNQTGAVTERYTFSAFGVESILAPDFTYRSSSECMWNFTFQGQFQDSESQFLNYGYRYYSPYCGRWLSRDPIAEKGGINLYAYVGNGPLNRIDPFGLSFVDFIAGVSDGLTFGLADGARRALGAALGLDSDDLDNMVNKKCSSYGAGQWTGRGLLVATTAGWGAANAATTAATAIDSGAAATLGSLSLAVDTAATEAEAAEAATALSQAQKAYQAAQSVLSSGSFIPGSGLQAMSKLFGL